MSRPPAYAYVAALFLGLVAAAAPANFPFADRFVLALLASTVVFGVAGFVCGILWPALRWRWALWIVGPGTALVTLGALTSGDYADFLADDLPFLLTGFLGAVVGAAAAARVRARGRRES